MQDAKFNVAVDPITKVIHVKCSGFWFIDEAKRYIDRSGPLAQWRCSRFGG